MQADFFFWKRNNTYVRFPLCLEWEKVSSVWRMCGTHPTSFTLFYNWSVRPLNRTSGFKIGLAGRPFFKSRQYSYHTTHCVPTNIMISPPWMLDVVTRENTIIRYDTAYSWTCLVVVLPEYFSCLCLPACHRGECLPCLRLYLRLRRRHFKMQRRLQNVPWNTWTTVQILFMPCIRRLNY